MYESFENGWYDQDTGQVPNDWNFTWLEDENPFSVEEHNKFDKPETNVKHYTQIPENERDLFILEGEHTFKAFGTYRAWHGVLEHKYGFSVQKGGVYCINLAIYGDLVDKYVNSEKIGTKDPNSGRIRINGGKWQFLAPLRWNLYKEPVLVENGKIPVSVEFMFPHAVKNTGVFCDLWYSELFYEAHECWGEPREDYERTYVLLPPNAGAEWAEAVATKYWDRSRWTIGSSADDAGMGALNSKVVKAVNPDAWGDDLEGFFALYYPGVVYEAYYALTPNDLDLDGNGNTPPPKPPNTRGYLGLHVQVMNDAVDDFVATVKPGIMKSFSHQDAERWKLLSPDTPVVVRNFVEHQGQYLEHSGGYYAGAQAYISTFSDSLWKVISRLEGKVEKPYFYVESLNEEYPSLNRPMVKRAAEFDVEFAKALWAEFGSFMAPALFCAAVANPHESEFDELERVADACEAYGGMMGYHSYWEVANGVSQLITDWPWHAGRWTVIDAYLVKRGYKVNWYGGEGGPIGDGLNAHAGWRASHVYNEQVEPCLDDLMHMDEILKQWNERHEYRHKGIVMYTSGATFTKWPSFQWWGNEVRAQKARLLAKYF